MSKALVQKDVFYPNLFSDDERRDCMTRKYYPLAYAVAAKYGLFIVKDAVNQKEIAIGNQSGFTVVVAGLGAVGRRLRSYDKAEAFYLRTNRNHFLVSTKLPYMIRRVNQSNGDCDSVIKGRVSNNSMLVALRDLSGTYDQSIRARVELKLDPVVANILLDNYEKPIENLPMNIKDDLDRIIKERKLGIMKLNKYVERRATMFTPPKWVVIYTSFGWHVGRVQMTPIISQTDISNVTEFKVTELEVPKLYRTWRNLPDAIKGTLVSKLLIIKTSRGSTAKADEDGLIPADNYYCDTTHGLLSAKHPSDGAYFVMVNV